MFYLMKLEMERLKRSNLLITALIINIVCFSLIFLMVFLIKLDPTEKIPETLRYFPEIIKIIESLVGLVFIIYASVILSNIYVKEFRDKTISILFMYPVKRTKILWSKVIIVSVYTFLMVLVSSIVIALGIYTLSNNTSFMYSFQPIDGDMLMGQFLKLIIFSISCAGLSLIPIFFGMLKQSIPATIVSAISITFLLNAGKSDYTMVSYIAIPAILGIAGFFIAHVTIQKSVKMDL